MRTTTDKDGYCDGCGYRFAGNCTKQNDNIRQYQHAADMFNAEHNCKAIIIKDNICYSPYNNLPTTDTQQFSVWLAPNCPSTESFWESVLGRH